MTKPIFVDGQGKFKVVENLGYNHDIGMYAKIVLVGTEERTAVARQRSGPWRFWSAQDRITPLLEGLAARLREEKNARQAKEDLEEA